MTSQSCQERLHVPSSQPLPHIHGLDYTTARISRRKTLVPTGYFCVGLFAGSHQTDILLKVWLQQASTRSNSRGGGGYEGEAFFFSSNEPQSTGCVRAVTLAFWKRQNFAVTPNTDRRLEIMPCLSGHDVLSASWLPSPRLLYLPRGKDVHLLTTLTRALGTIGF